MAARKFKYFQKEDVNVRFPDTTGNIEAQRGVLPESIPEPTDASNFTRIRTVMNLELVEGKNTTNKKLTFDSPVEFHVRYTKADLDKAKIIRKTKKTDIPVLCLGYWDDKAEKWIPLTQSENKSCNEWDEKKERGLIKVLITKWGDPPIAIGT